MMTDIHKAQVIATLVGVLLGCFLMAFIFYPPHPGWGMKEHWGDWATWFGALGSSSAAAVALFISGRDQRRRDAERKESSELTDFRAAILLAPAFGNLEPVVQKVKKVLAENQPTSGWLIIKQNGLPIVDLKEYEFQAISDLDFEIKDVSREFGKNVLATVGWCRHLIREFEQGTNDYNQRTLLSGEAYMSIVRALDVIEHFLCKAKVDIGDVIGDALNVPDHLSGV